MPNNALGTVFVIFSLLNFSNTAFSCDCVAATDPNTFLKKAKLAFVGDVTKSTTAVPFKAEFGVTSSFKGNAGVGTTVEVVSVNSNCAIQPAVGEKYLVFARDKNGSLEMNKCSTFLATSETGKKLIEELEKFQR
jgi:hypothetical protein